MIDPTPESASPCQTAVATVLCICARELRVPLLALRWSTALNRE
jgi:hypothetical protein